MFWVLRIKHFIKSLFIGFFFCGFAILFLTYSGIIIDAKAFFTKPVNLNELAIEDIKTGVRVKAEISVIYDAYGSYEEDGKVKSKGYLIPVGKKKYMGLVCDGSDMKDADAVMQSYWDYLEGKISSEDSLKTMTIKGTIMPLDRKEYIVYQQYIDKIGLSKKAKKKFLPYAVMVGKIGKHSKGSVALCWVFALAAFVTGILTLFSGFTGGNLKQVEKYCCEQGNKKMYMRELEDFYNSGIPVQGIRIDEQFFMAVKGANCFFAEIRDLLWVYKKITSHYTSGIPTGKTHALIVKKEDGKSFDIPMKNEAAADEAMNYVAQKLPYLIFGYDNDLQKKYFKDPSDLIYEVERRRQEYLEWYEKQNSMAGGDNGGSYM